jgi:S-disulfanyl-L-cysteine oxidoreductase SoxD
MNELTKRGVLVAAGLALLMASAAVLKAQDAAIKINDGVYTEAQANRGKAAYLKNCQSCHGETMTGIDTAPSLVGGTFLGNWTGQSLGDLAARVRTTMPLNKPGTLGSATVADIISQILKANGYVAGASDLPRDVQVLQMIRIDAPMPAT